MRCMKPHLLVLVVATLAVTAQPAVAQQRVVVVPEAAGVVVPPRGEPSPRLVNAPRPRIGPPRSGVARQTIDPGIGAMGLAVPALVLLPLAVAAYTATALPGSGSSTSAPARTR